MNKKQNNLPPRPPRFLTMGFYIPPYQGELPQFDVDDIIEGEEACRAYDEEQKRLEGEKQDGICDSTPP